MCNNKERKKERKTNSSWLPWGRVAVPLISLLMPVPLGYCVGVLGWLTAPVII